MLRTDPPILFAGSLLRQTKIESDSLSCAFALPQLARGSRTRRPASESQREEISEQHDWDKSRDQPAPVPRFSAPTSLMNRVLQARSVPIAGSVSPPLAEVSAWPSST